MITSDNQTRIAMRINMRKSQNKPNQRQSGPRDVNKAKFQGQGQPPRASRPRPRPRPEVSRPRPKTKAKARYQG